MTATAQEASTHVLGEPPILYFGTSVVLISTLNEDGSANLAPMSSAFWLGWRCVLGLAKGSQTTQNLLRDRECVLNLPSDAQVAAVDRLALTTGSLAVPAGKQRRGYRSERRKFETAGLTPAPALVVTAPRAMECPVQMEGRVEGWHDLAQEDPVLSGYAVIFEVRIERVHLSRNILREGNPDRVDTEKWRPLIMSFSKFFRLADGELHPSRLASIPEALYRSPDVDRARRTPPAPR